MKPAFALEPHTRDIFWDDFYLIQNPSNGEVDFLPFCPKDYNEVVSRGNLRILREVHTELRLHNYVIMQLRSGKVLWSRVIGSAGSHLDAKRLASLSKSDIDGALNCMKAA